MEVGSITCIANKIKLSVSNKDYVRSYHESSVITTRKRVYEFEFPDKYSTTGEEGSREMERMSVLF